MNYFKIAKFFLYLVPFTVIIVTSSTIFPFIVGKYVWFRTNIDFALLFFLLGLLLRDDAKQYKSILKKLLKSPLFIAISLFTFVFLMASIFGLNPKWSFWSNFERGEGAFQILHLYLFFILLTSLFREDKDWRKMFWLSVIAASFMIFYGLGAGLKYVDAEFGERIVNDAPQKFLTGQGGPLFRIFKNFIGPAFNDPGYRFQGSMGNAAYVAT